ncbi:MAG TPA: 8-amino-7-oxononanoate synthase [Planctomycetaceae bacterium]|nr:8-amino-7-oxononanoate synthase [Planctomycetaceae bacterium]
MSKHTTHNRLAWIDRELDTFEEGGVRRHLRTRKGVQTAQVEIDGRSCISFGSNDYLGLAADQRLSDAVADALQTEGWGSGASPLLAGHAAGHRRLEQRLAQFEGTEAALLCTSGFAANSGCIAALVGPGDVVFTDRKNHASLLDGCRLSRADTRVYPHNDTGELGRLLGRASTYRRRLIVTDTLFSMDGDLAPLAELADLAERHDAMLMVDEAHATGVFGARGRGVAEMLDVEHRVDVRVGTLSKALGSIGGFVVGSRSLVEWLVNRSRPYIFSTAMPAAAAAASIAALDIVDAEPERRAGLLARAEQLRRRVVEQGWNTGGSASQIIPLVVGRPELAVRFSGQLDRQGFYVPAVRPPTVPEGESCLRLSLTWNHTEEMIDRLVAALGKLHDDKTEPRA